MKSKGILSQDVLKDQDLSMKKGSNLTIDNIEELISSILESL